MVLAKQVRVYLRNGPQRLQIARAGCLQVHQLPCMPVKNRVDAELVGPGVNAELVGPQRASNGGVPHQRLVQLVEIAEGLQHEPVHAALEPRGDIDALERHARDLRDALLHEGLVGALLDQDLLAGKHTFDNFAFSVDKNGELELTDDGKEVLDEAMFLANSAEARGLPGYRGN